MLVIIATIFEVWVHLWSPTAPKCKMVEISGLFCWIEQKMQFMKDLYFFRIGSWILEKSPLKGKNDVRDHCYHLWGRAAPLGEAFFSIYGPILKNYKWFLNVIVFSIQQNKPEISIIFHLGAVGDQMWTHTSKVVAMIIIIIFSCTRAFL